jgi:predicted component of type VI protein secretion system
MKYVYAIMLVVMMIGCASERDKRSVHQMLSPDKLNMQLHVNPDINNDSRDSTEIHQVRIGLDWNL